MSRAEDLGKYYRVPSDNRDLNYDKYFTMGKSDLSRFDSYTSHNTKRLTLQEVKDLLLNLDYIKIIEKLNDKNNYELMKVLG